MARNGVARRPALAVLWLGLLSVSTSARAEEAALNWVRLEGAEDCIDAPRLAKLVEARIGRSVLQPPTRAELSIEAHVGPRAGGGFGVLVSVHDRSGARIGQRELHVDTGPCSQLDRPASLIISLILDPNAAGPGLIEDGALSMDAQHLLAQLDLPSSNPDDLLRSLDFAAKQPPRDPLAETAPSTTGQRSVAHGSDERAAEPPAKLVSVREDELLRLREIGREHDAPTPRWPAYAFFGLAGAAAATAVIAQVRINALNSDPIFTTYRVAAEPGILNACDAANAGLEFGLGADVRRDVADKCDEGEAMEVLFWAGTGTTLASAAMGAIWLLWIVDDDEPEQTAPMASLSVSPSHVRLALRLQM